MNINEIIKNEVLLVDVLKKHSEDWDKRQKLKEQVSKDGLKHMKFLISCIRNNEDTNHKAIDMDMLLYSLDEKHKEFADTYSYLFDALIAYARKNMLTFEDEDFECWFVVKYDDLFFEFNELHGQGSHISTRLLDDYEGPHFTMVQFLTDYKFDTTEAERLKMDKEFRHFLHERKNDGISEKIIHEVMEKYIKDKKI